MLDHRSLPLKLVIFAGNAASVHSLPKSGTVTLGRSSECDVRIDHPSVSRRHAVLHFGPPLAIEDLGSKSGTFVVDPSAPDEPDGTPALWRLSGGAAEIGVGDCVTLGSVLIVVRRDTDAADEISARRRPASAASDEGGAIVRAPAMRALYEQAHLVAESKVSVLILGETGVGKEVLARAIHRGSPRASGPFLGLNCAALSDSLLESELFGHEKGAFTGALEARPGLFEAASGGTVFLDEVGDLPMSIQVKLLRVLAERVVLRVGARKTREIDVRFVSATNRDVEADVARGLFREDLLFRLDGMTLTIPPLRERVAEIAELARTFTAKAARELGRAHVPELPPETVALLERHAWPGNVRELRNVIERAVALCRGPALTTAHLPTRLATVPATSSEADAEPLITRAPSSSRVTREERQRTEEAAERERIVAALEACGGNQTEAAERLGISRRTLVSRLDEYNLPRPRKKGQNS